MTSHPCAWCSAEVNADRYLCRACVKTLAVVLDRIPGHYEDLDTVRAKQTRFSAGAGRGSIGKSIPSPVDERFLDRTGDGSRLVDDTKGTLVAWVRVLAEEYPSHVLDADHPSDDVPALCSWLGIRVQEIGGHQWAAEILGELLDLEKRLRRFVDRPTPSLLVGKCGSETDQLDGSVLMCDRTLYATPGRPSVVCPVCSCEYDVEARRRAMRAEAEDYEATVVELVAVVTELLGVEQDQGRLERRVRKWGSRGRLKSNGQRVLYGRVRPTYRVGDVLDLLSEDIGGKVAG